MEITSEEALPPGTPANHFLTRAEALKITAVWFLLRVFSSAAASGASSLLPLYAAEATPIWPPFTPAADWLHRLLVAPWLRWDGYTYQIITSLGYQPGQYQFQPLYPWLARPVFWLGAGPLLSLLILATAASLLLFFSFFLLSRLDYAPETTFSSLLLFVTFPSAYVLFAPYPESIFLLFAVLSIYLARRGNWWLAGLMGALAALTRQQGIFLVIPLAFELYAAKGHDIKKTMRAVRELAAIAVTGLGLVFWILYRMVALNDVQPDFSSLESFIYSVVISPNSLSGETAGNMIQGFRWPWLVLWEAIHKAVAEPGVDIIVNLVLVAVFAGLLALTWKKMRLSYKVYSVVIFLVSLSYYTGDIHPVMGLPRHLLLAFPIFLGLGEVVTKPRLRLLMAAAGMIGFMALVWLQTMETWVP